MRLWIKEHESLHESITNLVFFACLDPREGRKIVARAFKPWKMVIIKTQVPEGRLKLVSRPSGTFIFLDVFPGTKVPGYRWFAPMGLLRMFLSRTDSQLTPPPHRWASQTPTIVDKCTIVFDKTPSGGYNKGVN